MNVMFSKKFQCKVKGINYIESIAKQEWLFMKKVLAISAITILLFSSITSLTQTPSKQMAVAQTVHADFNFAAAGDWGCNSNAKNTIKNIIDKNPELVLGLGDYSYNKTSANCWLKIVDPIDEKMKIAIGNHENITLPLLRQYMSHFNLTNQYYSFNYQNVHFTVMSTELPFNVTSAQYNFVNNDLLKATSDPNIDWIVVYFHKLMVTSPSRHPPEPLLPETYLPLFEKYGVDLVLQGHNHHYERTYPIRFNNNNVTRPIETSTDTTSYTDPDGQIFVTVGTGGRKIHNFTSIADYSVKQYLGFGILDVDITNNGRNLTGKFYADKNGIMIDQFSITKN
jgi:predicted MPP superfamily phosphohydrolase